jgi:hypothetical protein
MERPAYAVTTSIPTNVGGPLNALIRTFSFTFEGLGIMRVSPRHVVHDYDLSWDRLTCTGPRKDA